jgi:hypothetical protein
MRGRRRERVLAGFWYGYFYGGLFVIKSGMRLLVSAHVSLICCFTC